MRKLFLILSLVSLVSIAAFGQKKTVTNADLEKFKQKRLEAETEYEREAQKGNLPSREELEKREQERQKFLSEFSKQAEARQTQTENYWKSQAYVLRTEIASVEAEINYVRSRIGEIPEPQTYYAVGYLPYSFNNFGGVGFPQFPARRNSKSITAGGRHFGVGNQTQVVLSSGQGQNVVRQTGSIAVSAESLQTPRVSLNAGVFPTNNFNAPRTNLNFGGVPYTAGILAVPFTLPTEQNLTREELLWRLRSLEQTRAGLYARYDVLQDEARRAGVKID